MVPLLLTKSTALKYKTQALNFGIMDFRKAPKGKLFLTKTPPLAPFLEKQGKKHAICNDYSKPIALDTWG